MSEVILDTNVFVLYIIGLINPKKISSHRRTSIYSEDDFNILNSIISQYKVIITCPNILTELDNLLNNFTGDYKYTYLNLIREIINTSIEKYYKSQSVISDWVFNEIGLTDSVIIKMASDSNLLISDDSRLCDIAKSLNIEVFDLKEYVNNTKYR